MLIGFVDLTSAEYHKVRRSVGNNIRELSKGKV